MGKSAPTPPAAPDYAAAATAQGQADVTSAQNTASLSNPNIISPYGNQTVSYDNTGPNGDAQPTITQTLTPTAQSALTAQQSAQAGLAGLAQQATGTVQNVMGTPFQYNGPQIQTSLYPQSQGGSQQQTTSGDMPASQPSTPSGSQSGAGALNYGPSAAQYGQAQGFDPTQYGQAQGVNPSTYGQAQNFSGSGYGQAGSVDPASYGQAQGYSANAAGQAGSINANAYGQAQGVSAGPSAQSNPNLSGVAASPVNAGQTAYQAQMALLQPQITQSNQALTQQLANQGITPGSEAYANAQRTQGVNNASLEDEAASAGVGLDLTANQQGYNQALNSAQLNNSALAQNFGQQTTAAQLGNSAVAQNYGQGLSAQQLQNQAVGQNFSQIGAANTAQNSAISQNANLGLAGQTQANTAQAQNYTQGLATNQANNATQSQNFSQGATAAGLGNAAIAQNAGLGLSGVQQGNAAVAQNYGQGATSAGLYNTAQNQGYNQNLQSAQFGNTAAQQAYQQQLSQYNQPLNQIAALLSGSQIQNPQFQQYTGANVAAAPVLQATQAQGAAAQQSYANQVSAYNSQMSGLGGLLGGVGTALGAPSTSILGGLLSDARLKSNIIKIADDKRGWGIYEYDLFGKRQRGVMAQEVEQIRPDAVLEHPSGFKMVNYGALYV